MITKEYLRNHLHQIFVFGDNTLRTGKKGAALLRDQPNAYGFITKIRPSYDNDAYFTPETYKKVLSSQVDKLQSLIIQREDKIFLISKLGAGLANKFNIRPMIIGELKRLEKYENVRFLQM